MSSKQPYVIFASMQISLAVCKSIFAMRAHDQKCQKKKKKKKKKTGVQSTLVISTSIISINRLSRRENLILVLT